MGNQGKQKRPNRNVTIQTPEDAKEDQINANRPKSTVARGQKNKGIPSSTPAGNQDGVLNLKKENLKAGRPKQPKAPQIFSERDENT